DGLRPAQRRVIGAVLVGRDVLAVLPTGGGKSICFQVPALALGGLTVVVSPLVSLMQDQVAAALARGIPAAALHSALGRAEQAAALDRAAAGSLRLLYLSPERLAREAATIRARCGMPALLVVDEAHCIVEWGDDFRPSYRRLREVRWRLGQPQAVALTATATPEARDRIVTALALGRRYGRGPPGWELHMGSFDRRNLWFGAVRVRDERDRLQRLMGLIRLDDRTALVYAATRGATERLARELREAGFPAAAYHAGLPRERRDAVLRAFLDNELRVVVATCAFGMGIDKPDVRLVVHWTVPATPESYFQEAGRAGRDGLPSRCVVLWRPGDTEIHRRQLAVTFPDPALAERVWRDPAAARRVPRSVAASIERLRAELAPERGPVDWRAVLGRRAAAAARLEVMEAYLRAGGCRRRRLLAYFGDLAAGCAGCDRCAPLAPSARLPAAAAERLRRLRALLADRDAPWGGSLLDPPTVVRLALHPPQDGVALARTRGVGPVLAERYGGAILRALNDEGERRLYLASREGQLSRQLV
ncbi:MAG TPA: RecQ family ATP-dependent DNA helicase, partial [Gemmatimonadales bacterium]|nr:RecQ family ATP-dependent DNA helicase [Gemmatimonadales bacterium]